MCVICTAEYTVVCYVEIVLPIYGVSLVKSKSKRANTTLEKPKNPAGLRIQPNLPETWTCTETRHGLHVSK